MPHWTLPLDPAGLVVPVVVTLAQPQIASLQVAGGPAPPMLPGRGLIDTGTDACAISPSLVARLGLTPHARRSTQTVAGSVQVSLYRISLLLHGPAGPTGPLLVESDLFVLGLLHDLSDQIDILIGLDFLDRCLLVIDWPTKQFTLAF